MMRQDPRLEPASFPEKVGKPGENVLALLAGRPLPHRRKGRPIELMKKVGKHQVPKTIEDFPYWQECADDLHAAYGGICAYYCFYVERANHPHVDHFAAKSATGDSLAYKWHNYRLACGHANARKREFPDVLDPQVIEDGWFQLDLLTLRVNPDPLLPQPLRQQVDDTIARLDLRGGRALEIRRRAIAKFRRGLPMEFLAEDHPYLARELTCQGIVSPEQLPEIPSAIVQVVEPELDSDAGVPST